MNLVQVRRLRYTEKSQNSTLLVSNILNPQRQLRLDIQSEFQTKKLRMLNLIHNPLNHSTYIFHVRVQTHKRSNPQFLRQSNASFSERRTVRKQLELSGRNLRVSQYEHSLLRTIGRSELTGLPI